MSLTMQFILAMTSAIPAFAGLFKIKHAPAEYKPFLLLLLLAVATELISDIPYMINEDYRYMNIAHPLYNTAEVFLMLLFFERCHVIKHSAFRWTVSLIVFISYAAGYFYEPLKTTFVYYCSISWTALLALLSIRLLSNEIFTTKISVLKNPKMIIAFGGIFYYSFYLLVKVFVNLNTQVNLFGSIFSIHQIVNSLTYLIFTWAIICIPRSSKY